MTRYVLLPLALLAAACAGRSAPAAAPAPAAAAAPRANPPLRYASGTGRYKFESQAHVEQEAMGQTTTVDVATGILATVVLADAAGNLGMAVTIDSLGITTPMGGPGPDELAAAKGKVVRLVSSPRGEIISLTPPDSASPTLQQVALAFREFLPQLPPGAPDSGTTWTDTSTITSPSAGLAVSVHMTRQHRVVGWETRAGVRALHLATSSSYTVTGSGETQGQSINLTGGGARNADAFVSADGVYLDGSFTDSSLVNANVVSAGIIVPVKNRTRTTFTRLP